jgi:hypothetical protein
VATTLEHGVDRIYTMSQKHDVEIRVKSPRAVSRVPGVFKFNERWWALFN